MESRTEGVEDAFDKAQLDAHGLIYLLESSPEVVMDRNMATGHTTQAPLWYLKGSALIASRQHPPHRVVCEIGEY